MGVLRRRLVAVEHEAPALRQRNNDHALDAASCLLESDGGGAGRSRRGRVALSAIAAAVALSALLGLNAAVASSGATFVVDDTSDMVDRSAGDGVCRSLAGTCT